MADRKLFIGNLVRRITQDDLWVMYSAFGPLEECAKFHESFGFVRFLHADDARQALNATHGITVKGRCIKVEFAATTTTWRSANNASSNECRLSTRYNIPPIRAVQSTANRTYQHVMPISSSSFLPLPPIGPIGDRRKNPCESNPSTTNIFESRQCHISYSSPPSSYATSSSHIAEIDDQDCDLDSGYHDELDLSLVTSSAHSIPASPWYDMPSAPKILIWDCQLYIDVARDNLPLISIDHFSSEQIDDDDKLHLRDFITRFHLEESL